MTFTYYVSEQLQIQQVADNIYTFVVPLPDNPLRWLNTYVIKSEGRSLLIDTGFNRSECFEALMSGMKALNIKPRETDVFLTHLHSDHTGNAAALEAQGCRIIMGNKDHSILAAKSYDRRDKRMLEGGISPELLKDIQAHNPALIYATTSFDCSTVENGQFLDYGGYHLECVETPGHTPGHMCLYDRDKKLMFTGDNVLFDISPNITFWVSLEDSLGDYLNSLKKCAAMDIELGLPGHRTMGDVTVRERCQQLLEHHRVRLDEIQSICCDRPGLSAYEIAGLASWRIRANSWEDFPLGQKWFAVGETISHLDHLVLENQLHFIQDSAGILRYYP
jgi:glyoxylase-like metal-dependent hydrolase (beta-lactamase superfamily II)